MGSQNNDEESENSGFKPFSESCEELIKCKVDSAMQTLSAHCVHTSENWTTDLTFDQIALVTMLYSLMFDDLALLGAIAQLFPTLDLMVTSRVSDWMGTQFSFPVEDLARAVSKLAVLINSDMLIVPKRVLAAYSRLLSKVSLKEHLTSTDDLMALDLANLIISMDQLLEPRELENTEIPEQSAVDCIGEQNNEQEQCLKNPEVLSTNSNTFQDASLQEKSTAKVSEPVKEEITTEDPQPEPITVEVDGWTLTLSSSLGYYNIHSERVTMMLLERGADVNFREKDGMTPLHWASMTGVTLLIELLLKHGADPTAREENGLTPLHKSSIYGLSSTEVELLVNSGADVNARANGGWTPLHYAAQRRYPNHAAELLNRGADLEAKTDDGLTPLLLAVRNGEISVVECLLKHSADLHVKGFEGITALHLAATMNHLPVVELLLEHGADINVKVNSGFTPLTFARMFASETVFDYLNSRGGL